MQKNAAGEAVSDLLLDTWRTNTAEAASSRNETKVVRAFYGRYNVTLLYDGQPVQHLSDLELKEGDNLFVTLDYDAST